MKAVILVTTLLITVTLFAINDNGICPCQGYGGLTNIDVYYWWQYGGKGYLNTESDFECGRPYYEETETCETSWCLIRLPSVYETAEEYGEHWDYGFTYSNIVSIKFYGNFRKSYRAVISPASWDNLEITETYFYPRCKFTYGVRKNAQTSDTWALSEWTITTTSSPLGCSGTFNPGGKYEMYQVLNNIDFWIQVGYIYLWVDTESLGDGYYKDFVIDLRKMTPGAPNRFSGGDEVTDEEINRLLKEMPPVADIDIAALRYGPKMTYENLDNALHAILGSTGEDDDATILSTAITSERKIVGITIEQVAPQLSRENAFTFFNGKTLLAVNGIPIADFESLENLFSYLASGEIYEVELADENGLVTTLF